MWALGDTEMQSNNEHRYTCHCLCSSKPQFKKSLNFLKMTLKWILGAGSMKIGYTGKDALLIS